MKHLLIAIFTSIGIVSLFVSSRLLFDRPDHVYLQKIQTIMAWQQGFKSYRDAVVKYKSFPKTQGGGINVDTSYIDLLFASTNENKQYLYPGKMPKLPNGLLPLKIQGMNAYRNATRYSINLLLV